MTSITALSLATIHISFAWVCGIWAVSGTKASFHRFEHCCGEKLTRGARSTTSRGVDRARGIGEHVLIPGLAVPLEREMPLKLQITVIALCLVAFAAAAEAAPPSTTAPPATTTTVASGACAFTSAAETRGISDGDCAIAPPARTITVAPGACAHTSTAKALGIFDDGCAGAPAGTPQLPGLLQAYRSHRPKWDVAGVDYYVGMPSDTVLKDPAAAPDGCSYDDSTPTLQCNGDGLIVSGYDFSLHGGTKIKISGSNNTITKNNFAQAPNCQDPLIYFTIDSGASLNISQNSFDGGSGTCKNLDFGGMVFGLYGDKSKLTMQYNYFYGTPQDVINNTGPKSGSATLVVQYNLFDSHGYHSHAVVQFHGGNFTGSAVNFNTYNNPYTPASSAGTQAFHIEAAAERQQLPRQRWPTIR